MSEYKEQQGISGQKVVVSVTGEGWVLLANPMCMGNVLTKQVFYIFSHCTLLRMFFKYTIQAP